MRHLGRFAGCVLLAAALSPASAAVWLQQRSDDGDAGKTFQLLQGTFPAGVPLPPGEADLYVRDLDGTIEHRSIATETPFRFKEPLKGSYHLFARLQQLDGETLVITVAKTRTYNRCGDPADALLSEIRGKTVASHYGKPPMADMPVEIVLYKPIKRHQVNCCIYSGDLLPFKVYREGKQRTDIELQVTTQKGWNNTIAPGQNGTVLFEVPRTTYADIATNKRYREQMLVTASETVAASGVYKGYAYRQIRYEVTVPLTYYASPLEYSSKLGGFLTFLGVILAFSLGAYYHRKRKRFKEKEAWFDDHA